MLTEFARLLIGWYAEHARILPWRGSSDPYAVWVSEIMLQQTRVDSVIAYYRRWMERFPTIKSLAQADEQEILQQWEGLGYYSRARNLHKAARIVMEQFGGTLPSDRAELEKLPGIGRYTAGAIGSIAFGQDAPALDGNLRRVLARVFDIDIPLRTPQGQQRLDAILKEHLPSGQAGDFNQAMMDLGATICTPRSPECARCPLTNLCLANSLGLTEQRPLAEERRPIPHVTVTAAVIQRNGMVLIARRPPGGLLGGMWEFPGGKLEPGESLEDCLKREILEELGTNISVGLELGVFKHAYTHFKVTLHAFQCELIGKEPEALEVNDMRWVHSHDLVSFPMGKIDRQIALVLSTSLKV